MIYRFVIDGGPWMLPILGASVIGLALSLERTWYWLIQALVRDRALRSRLRSGDHAPPGQTIRDPVARVLVEAVRRPDDLGIASARAEAILRESKAYLGLLRFVGGTAALGGLLGTAIGVRDVLHHTADPAQINAGIANALHPTILGLAVFVGIHTAAAAFHALTASLATQLDENLDDVARIVRRGPLVPARLHPPHSATPGTSSPTPSGAEIPAAAAGDRLEKPESGRVASSRLDADRTQLARPEPVPAPPSSGPDAHELAQALAAAGGD